MTKVFSRREGSAHPPLRPQPGAFCSPLALFLVMGFASIDAGSSFAHPVPRSEYDRTITVELRPDEVVVRYTLDLDQYTLLATVAEPANGFPIDPNKTLTPRGTADAYIARMKVVIADQLQGSVDGKPITFTCSDARADFTDSVQFRFRFKAPARLDTGKHTVELEDLNFPDKKGKVVMKLDAAPPLSVEAVSEPPEHRTTGLDDAEKRIVTATVVVTSLAPPIPAKEADVPAPDQPTTFWELFRKVREDENLTVLLDSNVGLGIILLLATLHGVMHSLAPGHGKTMVAAYLVGEQGTPRHAIILGLIVTLTHTSAAFAVALLLKFVLTDTAPQTIQSVLGFGGGLTVAFVGLWLLIQRLGGRAGHDHSHSHSHAHAHSHGGHEHSHGVTPDQFGRVGWARLIMLGLAGGVVPCWGAILWVLYCVTAGRFGLALWAVLAFSIGLASILILIGLSVVWGGRAGASRFGNRSWFRAIAKWLPIVGAALVIVIGLWLCRANLPK